MIQPTLMPGFNVEEDLFEADRASIRRQLDGVLTSAQGTYRLRILVEATLEKVDLENMDAKICKLGRLKMDKLVVVSAKGFTTDAVQAARDAGVEAWILRAHTDEDWDGRIAKIQGTIQFTVPQLGEFNLKTVGSKGQTANVQFSATNRDSWTVYDAEGNPRANLWDFFAAKSSNVGSHEFPVSSGDNLYVKGNRTSLVSLEFVIEGPQFEEPFNFDMTKSLIGVYENAIDPAVWRFVQRPPGFTGSLN